MQTGTHVTLPYCWNLHSAGTYFLTPTVFHFICMAGTHTHTHTPMNQHIHTSHVTPIYTFSTIRHYSFPLACKLLCCVLHRFPHMLCPFELFFSMSFGYSAFTGLIYNLFFCYVYIQIHSLYVWSYMCKYSITFYFFSGHNCISTKMVVCLVRLVPSTVCSYPMVFSTWSCRKASMSLMWVCFSHM